MTYSHTGTAGNYGQLPDSLHPCSSDSQTRSKLVECVSRLGTQHGGFYFDQELA